MRRALSIPLYGAAAIVGVAAALGGVVGLLFFHLGDRVRYGRAQ